MSDRIKDDMITIQRDWTLEDAEIAHLALDLAEDTAILIERRLEQANAAAGRPRPRRR